MQEDLQYYIDDIRYENNKYIIDGWAYGADASDNITFATVDNKNSEIELEKKKFPRPDLEAAVEGLQFNARYGFSISFAGSKLKKYKIILSYEDSKAEYEINYWDVFLRNLKRKKVIEPINEEVTQEVQQVEEVKNNLKPDYYNTVFKPQTRVTATEAFEELSCDFGDEAPKFSIVIPLFKTRVDFLLPLLDSIMNQTYRNFEVCLADGSPEEGLEEKVRIITNSDSRFKYKKLDDNYGISDNTNEAIKMATGDFILFSDHDDMLCTNLLYEYAKAITNNPEIDCLYADEDKVDEKGDRYYDPFFKPDFSIDYLTSTNYITHPFCVRKSFIDQYGALSKEYDGSQDHEFILRMVEHARVVHHVPKILYHWRAYSESTALVPESKLYAFKAGKKAVVDYYKRVWPNIKIDRLEDGIAYGIYHTIFHFDEYPLISIIIPNKDHIDDLQKAIESIQDKSTWKNLEFIVVENNSEDDNTFKYYEELQQKYDNVKVIEYDGGFSFAKICNYGVTSANGEYLLFLNNDTEMISERSIEEMMGYAQRDDVGIVGAQLLYRDNTVQHAGVIVGIVGAAGHAHRFLNPNCTSFCRGMIPQNFSAVTGAALLVRKSLFEQLHGFDEKYAVAYNDVDFCLRMRKLGKLVTYTPFATFYHYESKSRGSDSNPENSRRFIKECSRFISQYEDIIRNGDPYYNPNMTTKSEDYLMRDLEIEAVGSSYFTDEEIEWWKKQSEDNNTSQ